MAVSISVPPTVTVAVSGTQGVRGLQGEDGTAGTDGQDGAPGASAYGIWLSLGNSGTPQDFIDSLKGPKGDPGSGGGGGGVVPVPYVGDIQAGIIVLTAQADWTPVVGTSGIHVRRIIPNVHAGDVMVFTAEFLRIGTVYFLDGRILKADGSPGRYLSSIDDGLNIPGPEGYAPWYGQLSFKEVTGFRTFTVTADQIAPDGTWTIEMVYRGSGIADNSNHVYFGNGYNGSWDVWHWPFGNA